MISAGIADLFSCTTGSPFHLFTHRWDRTLNVTRKLTLTVTLNRLLSCFYECIIQLSELLADCPNGHAYATLLHLSVVCCP